MVFGSRVHSSQSPNQTRFLARAARFHSLVTHSTQLLTHATDVTRRNLINIITIPSSPPTPPHTPWVDDLARGLTSSLLTSVTTVGTYTDGTTGVEVSRCVCGVCTGVCISACVDTCATSLYHYTTTCWYSLSDNHNQVEQGVCLVISMTLACWSWWGRYVLMRIRVICLCYSCRVRVTLHDMSHVEIQQTHDMYVQVVQLCMGMTMYYLWLGMYDYVWLCMYILCMYRYASIYTSMCMYVYLCEYTYVLVYVSTYGHKCL